MKPVKNYQHDPNETELPKGDAVGRYAMEGPGPRGFGWDYAPGTTGESYPARYRCSECGESADVKVVRELGAGWTEPEECPKCGGEFDPDSEEEAGE